MCILVSPDTNSQGLPANIPSLAESTFAAFAPYINVYDSGVKDVVGLDADGELAFDVFHVITRDDWRCWREYKAEKRAGRTPNVVKKNGKCYSPYLDVVQHILSAKHCEDAINGGNRRYYTSGKTAYGMLYLDTDAHCDFQTDAAAGSVLLRRAFPMAFSCDSARGKNDLVKVYHAGRIEDFNALATRLEAALQRLFNRHHILCDVEVKGTITTPTLSGKLAKLPWNKNWSFHDLKRFKACKVISIADLEYIVTRLEAMRDDAGWAARREELKRAETTVVEARRAARLVKNAATKTANHITTTTPTVTPTTAAQTPPTTATTTPTGCRGYTAANNNPDRLQATIDIARLYAQQLRRVPTTDELLAFLHANGFFTGDWVSTLSARIARCQFVLRAYVAGHWDSSKLANPGRKHVDLCKWNKFVRQFPLAWAETLNNRGVDVRVRLTREDCRAYFAINWTLLTDKPNADGSVPFDAIWEFWEELHKTGKTSSRPTQAKIAALRAVFHDRDIIRITDSNYSPRLHKAIR